MSLQRKSSVSSNSCSLHVMPSPCVRHSTKTEITSLQPRGYFQVTFLTISCQFEPPALNFVGIVVWSKTKSILHSGTDLDLWLGPNECLHRSWRNSHVMEMLCSRGQNHTLWGQLDLDLWPCSPTPKRGMDNTLYAEAAAENSFDLVYQFSGIFIIVVFNI